jgi:8-oxo-dGTP pyrophosphatase MutT (NUDIX family)
MTHRIDETWYQRPPGIRVRVDAGGIVARTDGGRVYIASVRENDLALYVLPKGGVKQGEDLVQAARREIEEEAGLTQLLLLQKLAVRERLSYDKQTWLVIHYFLFATSQIEGTPTDVEHDYTLCWFPIEEPPPLLWPEQEELIETYRDRIIRNIWDIT